MKPRYLFIVLALLCVGPGPAVLADAFDPPASYYNSATGTGTTLKSQLHNIIDNHTFLFYSEARSALQVTDRDPNDPSNIILAYDRTSLDVSGLFASGIPGWDSGNSWNREHVWPRSRGINDDLGDDNSDLHNLRPSDPQINQNRGNFNFGGAFGQSYGLVSDGGTFWYPGDADAGMVARQSFYMAVRYDGSDSQTENLELTNGNPGSFGTTMGNLSRLIQWHYAAAPTDFERRRNDVIYDSYQGNRNPFIDRPEYVWSVFVDQNNDSRITIDGGTASPDTSQTTRTLDFGTAYVSIPTTAATQQVTLNKSGDDGTYYQVTVDGEASSSIEGRFNAFTTDGSDSQTLTIGMTTDTTTPGLKTGTVTINNLDVTTAGGAGRGANDADDVITTQFTVLDHMNGSFSGTSDLNTLTIDFGDVAQGSAQAGIAFDLFNLESAVGFTADMEIDTPFFGGSPELSVTGLTGTVAAGDSIQPTVNLDTTQSGEFSAVMLIKISDLDLPGEIQQTLILNLLAQVTEIAVPGDFDGDGLLTAQDIDLLFANLGGADPTYDLTNDGQVTNADADLWVSTLANTAYGDTDLDGDVDDSDLGTAFANYTGPISGSPASWTLGNTDGDADIDDSDLGSAFANYTGPQSPANVPEPASAVVLLVVAGFAARGARRIESS